MGSVEEASNGGIQDKIGDWDAEIEPRRVGRDRNGGTGAGASGLHGGVFAAASRQIRGQSAFSKEKHGYRRTAGGTASRESRISFPTSEWNGIPGFPGARAGSPRCSRYRSNPEAAGCPVPGEDLAASVCSDRRSKAAKTADLMQTLEGFRRTVREDTSAASCGRCARLFSSAYATSRSA